MAAGDRKDCELVLENKWSAFNDVVEGEETLEGHGGVAGAVEAVNDGGDEVGGGGT